MQTLLLFDIDGTLLQRASAAHADALRAALKLVHGVDVQDLRLGPGMAAGRTDGEIARMLLIRAGVCADRIDDGAEAVREQCVRLYAEICPEDLSDRVTPGIPELLEWIAARAQARLSLLTGNLEAVGRLKLRRAGIGHWFADGEGGFGSDSEDRTMLAQIARRRSGRALGLDASWPREQTIVIGDTPRDIACARADGVRCLAVTTGSHGAGELSGADGVAESSAELRRLLEQTI